MTRLQEQVPLPISNVKDVDASIEAFRAGNPDFHAFEDIVIELPVEPVSLHASRSRKDTIASLIQSVTSSASFILTGDVQIEIEWFLHPQKRYESDAPPDLDNILKPLLDALCGPNGIMVDNCQVRFISCNWNDWDRDDQQITIHIHFFELDWRSKKGLGFVHLGNGICFPINTSRSANDLLKSLELTEQTLNRYYHIRTVANNYWEGIGYVPGQRVFHISRLSEFPVVDLETLRADLESQLQGDDAYPTMT